MAVNSTTHYNHFKSQVAFLRERRRNFENAFNANVLNREDIGFAYMGLYLSVFTEFESFLEELFVGIVSGQIKHSSSLVGRRVRILPKMLTEEIIFANKKYIDWFPYEQWTVPRANLFLDQGHPYTQMSTEDLKKLENYQILRNVIAHKSKFAINKFNTTISALPLLPDEKLPGGYLRSIPNRVNGRTQIEIAFDEISVLAKKLCT